MDFYEALKNGADEHELRKTFEEQLEDAKKRVAADQEKADKKIALTDARNTLIDATLDYFTLYFDDNENYIPLTADVVRDILNDLERTTFAEIKAGKFKDKRKGKCGSGDKEFDWDLYLQILKWAFGN